MRRFFRDRRGAVTVIVSMLLIPAILISGTAVDVSTIYSGKSTVHNANEMALNSLLSDYDELLRDLYGLFAVTANDAEMQSIVNKYLSLTLFHDENASDGRILVNDMEYVADVQPRAGANIQNKEVLRRQIEEYVKLRAPSFLIEEALDKVENFTKFLPDLTAVLKKIKLDESMALLFELYQQLYYRIRYHDSYIYDTQLMPEIEPDQLILMDSQGFEVKRAKEIDDVLAGSADLSEYAEKIQNCKDDYLVKRHLYETAKQVYDEKNKEYASALLIYEEIEELYDTANTIFDPIDSIYGNAVNNYLNDVRDALPSLASDINSVKDAANKYKIEYERSPQDESALEDALDAKDEAIDDLIYSIRNRLNSAESNMNSKLSTSTSYYNDMDKKQKEMKKAEDKFNEEVSEAQSWAGDIQTDVAQKQAKAVYDALAKGGKTGLGEWALAITNTEDVVLDRWGFIGKIIGAVKNTLWITDPWEVIAEFKKQKLSKIPPSADELGPYLNNIENMSVLIAIIEYHKESVEKDIETLLNHLDKCSAALRGDEYVGMQHDVNGYKAIVQGVDMVGVQLGVIERAVTQNTAGSYFMRLGNYLEDPMISINGYTQMTLSEISDAFDIGLDTENSAEFNALLASGDVKTIPYFETLGQPGSPAKYTYFCNNKETLLLYAFLYQKYGDGTYWQYEWDKFVSSFKELVNVFFSGICDMIAKLAEGGLLDGGGASYVPLDIWGELRVREFESDYVPLLNDIAEGMAEFGTGQGDMSGTIWNIFGKCAKLLENALQTFSSLGIFLETDGIVNQVSMVTYNTNMFSCYTTQGGTSFQGYKFNKNINYQLGWEQEYMLLGLPSETLCLAAASGMIFAARLVFNVIGTFTVPTVNEFCMADPEPITQAIVRFIFALGETYIDIYQLRSKKEVPIVKFLDEHWTFGNISVMISKLEGIVGDLATGTIQNLLKSINAATHQDFPQLQSMIDDIDVKKAYSAGITMAAMIRLERRHGVGAITGSFWGGFSDAVTKCDPKDFLKKADDVDTRIKKWNGYKKENIGREEVWQYKGFDLKNVADDVTQSEKLEKIKSGQESKILSEAGSGYAKKIINSAVDAVWEAITPKMSYQDYMSVFMFFTPPLALVSRTQDLIAVNMTNVMQNSGVTPGKDWSAEATIGNLVLVPVYKEKDLPLSITGLFDLSKAHTAFELKNDVSIDLLFMSSAFFQDKMEGDIPLGKARFTVTSNRGY